MATYDVGGGRRITLCLGLGTKAPLAHLAAFAVHWVGGTAFVRLPQLSGVDGIAHVPVELHLITLRVAGALVQSDGAWVVARHGGGWVNDLR